MTLLIHADCQGQLKKINNVHHGQQSFRTLTAHICLRHACTLLFHAINQTEKLILSVFLETKLHMPTANAGNTEQVM